MNKISKESEQKKRIEDLCRYVHPHRWVNNKSLLYASCSDCTRSIRYLDSLTNPVTHRAVIHILDLEIDHLLIRCDCGWEKDVGVVRELDALIKVWHTHQPPTNS